MPAVLHKTRIARLQGKRFPTSTRTHVRDDSSKLSRPMGIFKSVRARDPFNPYSIGVEGRGHLAAEAFPISGTKGVIIRDALSTFEEYRHISRRNPR